MSVRMMRACALCAGLFASAAQAQSDAYTELSYPSGSLRIQAYLYRPQGDGRVGRLLGVAPVGRVDAAINKEGVQRADHRHAPTDLDQIDLVEDLDVFMAIEELGDDRHP